MTRKGLTLPQQVSDDGPTSSGHLTSRPQSASGSESPRRNPAHLLLWSVISLTVAINAGRRGNRGLAAGAATMSGCCLGFALREIIADAASSTKLMSCH
jgi:hypothetical protein